MQKFECLRLRFLGCFSIWVVLAASSLLAVDRPNILWITSEDNGCELGCYGDSFATTPNLDRLATQSLRYDHVWSAAPVCAPTRTAIITGMWPTSLGASHMRSEVAMPAEFKLLPTLLREAGYYCSNNVKEDYNVIKNGKVWDDSSKKAHWRNRKPGQPFFAVFNSTLSHESQIRTVPHAAIHQPEQVDVPKYHPDLPEVRKDWAQYYDQVTQMDAELGKVLAELEEDQLTETTIIFYFGDHGSGMPRGKRWLYQSGLQVPLLVSVPAKFRQLAGQDYVPGKSSDRLVSFVDLAPTVLSLCEVRIPENFHGGAILGKKQTVAPKYLYAFRDRMDERYDCSRAIRDQRYLYIRNFMPHRAQGQYLEYMYQTPTTKAWLAAAKAGSTTVAQNLFWELKPAEELYDLTNDPQQLTNLAGVLEYQADSSSAKGSDSIQIGAKQAELKDALYRWMIEHRDLGLMPEALMLNSMVMSSNQRATPWHVGANPSQFSVEQVLEAADHATNFSIGVEQVNEQSQSTDASVRYWSTIGLMYRGLMGQPTSLQRLGEIAEKDAEPVVRCVANEAIGRLRDQADRKISVERLMEIASAANQSVYVQMQVFDSLAAMNLSESELPAGLDAFGSKSMGVPARYDAYVERGVEALKTLAQWPELHTPIPSSR